MKVSIHPSRRAIVTLARVFCVLPFVFPASPAQAEAPVTLDSLTIVAAEGELGAPGGGAATSHDITPHGMELFGAPGGGNVYSLVSGLPSAVAQTVDAFGYANLMGGSKGLRVRGENASHGANGTVDGIPLVGLGPGPGSLWLFEHENLGGVTLLQGPVPPDRLSLFNNFGALDSRIRWPGERAERRLSLGAGSESFRRGFARVDTGEFAWGTRAFLSASSAGADKWRGTGEAPSRHRNFALAVEQPFGDLRARIYATRTDMAQHSYRPLSHAEAQDLSDLDALEYAADPAALQNWYGHNRQEFENTALIGDFEYRLGPHASVRLRPYYTNEEGYYLAAAGAGSVRQWLFDHGSQGVIAEARRDGPRGAVRLGYWHYRQESPSPPTAWKLYSADASGGLAFSSWQMLVRPVEDHAFDSVYLAGNRAFGALTLEAGARYVRQGLPGLDFLNAAGIGDVSYREALRQATGVVPGRSVDGRDMDYWLPYFGASWRLHPAVETRLSAGRTLGAPALDAWPQYQSQYAAFITQGITAQRIMDSIRPEINDGIDLGLRARFMGGYVEPTLYYAEFRHKGVAFYDPQVDIAYPQNVGAGHRLGAQLVAGWFAGAGVEVFGTVSRDRVVFDEDIVTAGGATLEVDGKQLPDTPEWMANLGLKWQIRERFQLMSLLRHSGSRYADSMHTEKAGAYTTFDVRLGYRQALGFGTLGVSLAALNALDERYIGQINASEAQSSGAFSYYPGAPRTFVAGMDLSF